MAPNIKPIGPLLSPPKSKPDNSSCLKWLDQQASQSVIYVAFGSFTNFETTQFQELAFGLELTGKPFLWVVRSDITNGRNNLYPDGFEERISGRGLMVDWTHQQMVLSHPSIACFVSHCGWNSTIEGLSNGVPFLCWPYFADQFFNQSYICDYWGVGLEFQRDGRGIITREEIRNKVEQLVGNGKYKATSLVLKETVMNSIGETDGANKNFKEFVQWLSE